MKRLVVSIAQQHLILLDESGCVEKTYSISTATSGAGEQKGSEQTPRGLHKIRAKIGSDYPKNTVFVARRATGERYTSLLSEQQPNRDWILTRILWLSGLEPGKNRFGNVDSMARYIYIHGVPDEADLSIRRSKGCINMTNDDIVDLFDRVEINDIVQIVED